MDNDVLNILYVESCKLFKAATGGNTYAKKNITEYLWACAVDILRENARECSSWTSEITNKRFCAHKAEIREGRDVSVLNFAGINITCDIVILYILRDICNISVDITPVGILMSNVTKLYCSCSDIFNMCTDYMILLLV